MTPAGPALRVLVACEFSGIVRDAFRARGHDARNRSRTLPGVAAAMAEQWGEVLSRRPEPPVGVAAGLTAG